MILLTIAASDRRFCPWPTLILRSPRKSPPAFRASVFLAEIAGPKTTRKATRSNLLVALSVTHRGCWDIARRNYWGLRSRWSASYTDSTRAKNIRVHFLSMLAFISNFVQPRSAASSSGKRTWFVHIVNDTESVSPRVDFIIRNDFISTNIHISLHCSYEFHQLPQNRNGTEGTHRP